MDNIITKPLDEMTMEELVEARERLGFLEDELAAAKVEVGHQIITQLKAAGEKGRMVGDRAVSYVTRVSFSPSLDDARDLGVVITKEVVDTKVLKKLHNKGVEIPNTRITDYVTIKTIDHEEKGGEDILKR